MSEDQSKSRFSLKRDKVRSVFQHFVDGITGLFYSRIDYIQMRLSVDKITKEFEDSLREKIEHNVVHAKIREASEEDIEHIMKVYDLAWHSSPMPIRDVGKATFLKIFKEPTSKFLIASIDSQDAGFILIDLEGRNNEIGLIGGLGVLPKFQHKGVGTVLAIAAWDYFKKKGAKELRCEVYKDNLIPYSFIKSLGFEEYTKSFDFDHLMK